MTALRHPALDFAAIARSGRIHTPRPLRRRRFRYPLREMAPAMLVSFMAVAALVLASAWIRWAAS